ncbi:MAG TPA: hypothetical protein VFV08_14155 [Puia sp.]|nr:hypothetical protein [Puia sp.]
MTVSTFAGGAGYLDGTGTAALFSSPLGIVSDHNGNFYIADTYNSRIRKMTSNAVVTTLSGSDIQGNKDGNIDTATFYYPRGIAMDSHGNLFITSINGSNIRKITPTGIVSTFAGDPNAPGYVDATGTAARFTSPGAITIDGNDNIFVTDGTTQGSIIRKITSTGVVTTFAGSGLIGSADGNGTSASFNQPTGLVTDPNGNLFVSDYGNNNIRKITPAGDVTTFAGNGIQGTTDGPALSASFYSPVGIARDANGNFYVTESDDKIRIITSDEIVTSLAGDDQAPSSVDGVGKYAGFASPSGIAIGPDGVIYVLDSYYSFIRKMIVE